MDYIKKTICLEGARTRTQGIMPYYEIGVAYPQHSGGSCSSVTELGLTIASGYNGNWGQFVATPCFLAENGKTYDGMLHNYYSILNMVRDGIKLRRVETKDGEIIFVEDMDSFVWNGTCFDFGAEPDSIYFYSAYDDDDFHAIEIDSLKEETRFVYRYSGSEAITSDYVVLIQDFHKFSGMSCYLNGVTVPNTLSADTQVEGDEHTRWVNYCKVVDACIGKITIPATIYNNHIKVPKSMPCADVEEYIAWLETNKELSGNCCNARLWDDMGGDEMLEFLNASAKSKYDAYLNAVTDEEFKYTVPYIEMPLLLVQNFTDVGVLTNLDGDNYEPDLLGPSYDGPEKTRPHGKLVESILGSGFTRVILKDGTEITAQEQIDRFAISGQGICIDQIKMKNRRAVYPKNMEDYEENPGLYDGKTVEVESLLKTLRTKRKYTDDENNVLPGLFQNYDGEPGGKYFMCEKNGTEWVLTPCEGADLVNGDGMTSDELANATTGTNLYYRSVTTESAAKRIAEVYDQEPKWEDGPETPTFYFKVKYDNSSSRPMKLPYSAGNATNIYLYDEEENIYRADFISSVTISNKEVEIVYIVGGYYKANSDGKYAGRVYTNSGDVYYEKHTYDSSHVDYVTLDGVDNVPIYSQYIDFDADAKEIYSPIYNLYRTGNTANIIEATTGEEWTKLNEEGKSYAYDAYLTKEEYLTNFSLPPKVDVNVTIDRGGVSAFEKHYKLSECNTMQDLVNYGNNFFNL